MPPSHLERLRRAATAARATETDPAPVETLLVEGGQHSWLYEFPTYRRTVASFLATALGGPMSAEDAGRIAAETAADRIPDGETRFAAVADEPGGLRTLARVALPGATQPAIRDEVTLVAAASAPLLPSHDRRRDRPGRPMTDPVWAAIDGKRAIRRFDERPLEPAHLDRILRAGRRSGSSKNRQRWDFIVVPRSSPPAGAGGGRGRSPPTSPAQRSRSRS